VIVYLDSSWLLRDLLKQTQSRNFPARAEVYSSTLLVVECRRVLDRHFRRNLIDATVFANTTRLLQKYLDAIHLIELTTEIMTRAADSFYLPLGSLDAIHLSTALKMTEAWKKNVSLATYDNELSAAAEAHGLQLV